MARRKAKYERIYFIGAAGTRDFYRSAAKLAGGMRLEAWIRETLHKEASRIHARKGVEHEAPPVHPVPPPPLQPGVR